MPDGRDRSTSQERGYPGEESEEARRAEVRTRFHGALRAQQTVAVLAPDEGGGGGRRRHGGHDSVGGGANNDPNAPPAQSLEILFRGGNSKPPLVSVPNP